MSVRVAVPVATLWRSPDAVRGVDAPAVADAPDAGAWAAALDTEARGELRGRVDTQALLGEPVIVLAERAGWSEVRLPWQASTRAIEGYPGWLRSAHLVEAAASDDADDGCPRAAVTELTVVAHDEAGAPLELSLGTTLPLLEAAGDAVRLRHPDGRVLSAPAAAVAPLPDEARDPAPRALALARRFLGLPYLWAGLSGHGVDCSGLVHLSHRAAGVLIPRDAQDQAIAGAPVAREAVRPGEPVYFENASGVHHVGLALGAERMLHSPRTGMRVAEAQIADPHYSGERVGFRRFGA